MCYASPGFCIQGSLTEYLLNEVNEDARGNRHLCNGCCGKE